MDELFFPFQVRMGSGVGLASCWADELSELKYLPVGSPPE